MVLETRGEHRLNAAMRRLSCSAACLAALVLGSCSPSDEVLRVKSFVLRDQERDTGTDPWARMEKQARLHGAISMEERSKLLGQYFTVLWNQPEADQGPVKITFEFLQGGTGSQVKQRVQTFPAAATSGRAEFSVIGEDYRNHGRVLAWQVRLYRGDREIASRRSYLWK